MCLSDLIDVSWSSLKLLEVTDSIASYESIEWMELIGIVC